jgi:hypothetical protein
LDLVERSSMSSAGGQPAPHGGAPRRSLAALERLRQRLRKLVIKDGVVWLALLVAAAMALSFALDYLFDLPRPIRALFLVAGAGGVAVLAFRRLVGPLAVPVSDESLALLVEEVNPGLKQSLITAVELSRPESESARHVSPALLASIVEDVERQVDGISFEKVFRLGRLRRNQLALAGLAAIAFGSAVSAPEVSGTWFRRNLLLRAERWPKATLLELEQEAPWVVAIGDNLPVAVRVLKGDPKTVSVEREAGGGWLGGGRNRSSLMDRKDKASWDIVLENSRADPGRVLEVLVEAGVIAEGSAAAGGPSPARRLDELQRRLGRKRLARGLRPLDAEKLAAALTREGVSVRLEGFDLYTHEFKNVSQSFSFSIEGGDDRIGPYEVDVRLRPRIDMQSIEVTYRYPQYTGRAAEEIVQAHGNLKVPAGTRVSYRMATNIPVRRAFFSLREIQDEGAGLQAGGGRQGRPAENPGGEALLVSRPAVLVWPDPGAVELELTDGRQFGGGFEVTASGYYYFQFEEASGFRSINPEKFRIQAIPDRKPQVRMLEPTRATEEVSADAKVIVRAHLSDDHGLRRGVLEGKYFAPGSDVRVPQAIALPGVGAEDPAGARKEHEVELVLDIGALATGTEDKPAPGARFEFYLLAEDFGITGQTHEDGSPQGNIGQSSVHLLQIVEKEQLERRFTDQLMIVRDQLRQLLARQEAVRKDLERFQGDMVLRGHIPPEEAHKLSRHRQDQTKVSEGLERQAEEMERILARLDANAVGDEAWKRWIREIQGEVARLAKEKSKGIEQAVDALRRDAQAAPADPSRLGPITARQREVERGVRTVVMRLSEFGDMSAIIQLLRDLRRRQAELRDQTRDQLDQS